MAEKILLIDELSVTSLMWVVRDSSSGTLGYFEESVANVRGFD
jgi:hypothetical protein